MNKPDEDYAAVRAELEKHFRFTKQAIQVWQGLNDGQPIPGLVCICGHPDQTHGQPGLCGAGDRICFCSAPRSILRVSDIRYFFRATKGPHEAHAMTLGLQTLISQGGEYELVVRWQCQTVNCMGSQGIGPVRFRPGGKLAFHLPLHEQNRLMCERCLFTKLNGSFLNG
jgi:hypothetical protein